MIGCDNDSLELQPQTSTGGRRGEEVFLITGKEGFLSEVTFELGL